jgi:PD-(D/E)XK nuclease superfamily protein
MFCAGGEIHKCKDFKTFKERGEWVELCFMVQVIEQGFKVSKPWGDSSAYDVGVESGSRVLKVQVKSTDCRTEFGYLCQFKPGPTTEPYTLEQVDFFAAYIIPKDVWYLIPVVVLLGGQQKKALTLLPSKPRHPGRYRYECYREAWKLLGPILNRSKAKANTRPTVRTR